MKVIIQIPCFNEEEYLPRTIADLPTELPGVDQVEWLVVDDGSNDRTAEVARELGVHHIVHHLRRQGLAQAFLTGLNASMERGADIIVNTDADNQYCAADIPLLVRPILDGDAHMVVGSRPIREIGHFSPGKKLLQRLGSWAVRKVSNTGVLDAPSGFRAISRQAAMKLNVFNKYTYTLETIIQAGQKGIPTISVPVRVNQQPRPSRLMKSAFGYVYRSASIIVRVFVIYRPFRFFMFLGSIPFTLGLVLGLRFLWAFSQGQGTGMVQSLILASLLMGSGFLLAIVGLLADLISVNRQLLEKLDWQVRQLGEGRGEDSQKD
jgi:glycosyltransferase involved in cell wall biosynthesis